MLGVGVGLVVGAGLDGGSPAPTLGCGSDVGGMALSVGLGVGARVWSGDCAGEGSCRLSCCVAENTAPPLSARAATAETAMVASLRRRR